jgi:hypothetical protein
MLEPLSLENHSTGIKIFTDRRKFAKKLLDLFSQDFSDKDGEFKWIPLQTMMLGEAFMKHVEEYCSKEDLNLPKKLNLLDLFKKFHEKNVIFTSVKRMQWRAQNQK